MKKGEYPQKLGRHLKVHIPLLCRLGIHRWRKHWTGYLPYQLFPTTIEQCTRCPMNRRKHDIDGEKRPKNLPFYEPIGNKHLT